MKIPVTKGSTRGPRGPGWREHTESGTIFRGARRWLYMPHRDVLEAIVVVVTCDYVANDGDDPGSHWEDHASISVASRADPLHENWRFMRHATDAEVSFTVQALRMHGCMEDNHADGPSGGAGKARNVWLALDPAHRRECECKTTEEVIVEADGFTYSRERAAAAT